MILVTGASGTLGSEVVRALETAGVPFKAAYHTPSKADAARARGINATALDYNYPETLRAAFRGIERLFLLGPPVLEQTRLELNAVAAAQQAGVKHVVKLSTVGAEDETFLIGRVHRQAERALEALENSLRADGLPKDFIAWLLDLERYYREGRASVVTDSVKRLTGRTPTPFEQFARNYAVRLQPIHLP